MAQGGTGFLYAGGGFTPIDVPGAGTVLFDGHGLMASTTPTTSWEFTGVSTGGHGFVATPIPEPCTLLLLGSGLIRLAGYGRKKLFKE